MNATPQSSAVHSAIVRMELRVNGRILPIAQLGPTFLVLKEPIDHPPASGEITMSIDGREDRWCVHLPDGMSAASRKSAISNYSASNGDAGD